MESEKLYKIYALATYKVNKTFINDRYEEYEIEEICDILEQTDKGYHERILEEGTYKLFGDLDNYVDKIDDFIGKYVKFMKSLNINIDKKDFKYTTNEKNPFSYHFVISKYYGSCKKLKEIHQEFYQYMNDNDDLWRTYQKENGKKIGDTSIYANHWFRLPNQSKEQKHDVRHIIKVGEMKDFVLAYVENTSISIDNLQINKSIQEKKKKINQINQYVSPIENIDDDKYAFVKCIEHKILYKFFDLCYQQIRFDDYDSWISVGMSIKNRYGNKGFELFQYFSNKGKNADSDEKLRKKYDSFEENLYHTKTIATLYYFAKIDNKKKYAKLIKLDSPFANFDMTSTDVAKYIKLLKENDIVWSKGVLYYFNGKYWEKDHNAFRYYISNGLYDFLKEILFTCFWDLSSDQFARLKGKVDKLKTLNFKKEVIETTKEYLTNNNITFDNEYQLFGFNNIVYDLKTLKFRDYRYDDYISITTGYDWEKPSKKHIEKINDMVKKIMPKDDDRELLLEIMGTGLEGRPLEKFIVFNGEGGNGKGFLDDLFLMSIGNYGMSGNGSLIFEKARMGANPELSMIDRKRYVVIKEPPATKKIENSIVKELTGGGRISARGLYEGDDKCQKQLHLTLILECNAKPLLTEEPRRAELRRFIDILFGSKFTDNPTEVDENKHIYLSSVKYKDKPFQNKYKTAMLQIVFDAYKNYSKRNFIFDVPKSIVERTYLYLEMSCGIMGWIKENYQVTNNVKDIVKLKDIFFKFKGSEYYFNLAKSDKRKYNVHYFYRQISENIFFSKYYVEKGKQYSNYLTNYKLLVDDNNEDNINY